MRFIFGLAILLLANLSSKGEGPQWCEGYGFAQNGTPAGYAEISLPKQTFVAGNHFKVDVKYVNTGGGHRFFNPFFNGLLPQPAVVAVFDSKGNFVHTMFWWRGSQRPPEPGDWVFIPRPGYAGTVISWPLPMTMPPGTYYVQVIFSKGFIAEAPRGESREEMMKFANDFDGTELFRSNIVQIEVEARK